MGGSSATRSSSFQLEPEPSATSTKTLHSAVNLTLVQGTACPRKESEDKVREALARLDQASQAESAMETALGPSATQAKKMKLLVGE